MTKSGARTVAVRIVGVFFAGTALFNALGTVRIATGFLQWLRDGAWLPPFRWFLAPLVRRAPAVVAAVVVFQTVLAYLLLRLRHVNAALRLAQLFVLGLIPCLAWPYWIANVFLGAAFEAVRRGAQGSGADSHRRRPGSGHAGAEPAISAVPHDREGAS